MVKVEVSPYRHTDTGNQRRTQGAPLRKSGFLVTSGFMPDGILWCRVLLARFKEVFPGAAKTDVIDARKIIELFHLRDQLPLAKVGIEIFSPILYGKFCHSFKEILRPRIFSTCLSTS